MIHENSHRAYADLDVTARERSVLECLRALDRPSTDRQIFAAFGGRDMNEVRPSITRLVKAGILMELESVKCPVTGMSVRRTWFAAKEGLFG